MEYANSNAKSAFTYIPQTLGRGTGSPLPGAPPLAAAGTIPPMSDTPDLDAVAALVRDTARQVLPARFARVAHRHKGDGSLVTEADQVMERALGGALARRWPGIGFLSEEMPPEVQQARLDRAGAGLWCLDPLDGTTNFTAGFPFFSVSLALLQAGTVGLGVVYDPLRDECFAARRGGGVRLNGAPLARPPATGLALADCVAVVDFKRLPPELARLLATRQPYRSQRNLGTCALEWAWLAAGRFQLYLHGGQKLWDRAAGALILEEAGGFCRGLEDRSLEGARLRPQSVVAALEAEHFHSWCRWLREAGALAGPD